MSRLRHWFRRAVTIVVAMMLTAVTFAAQQQTDGFVTLKHGESPQEVLPATPFVFAAYAFIWVALIAYLLMLFTRLKKVEHELADLRAKNRTRA